MEVAWFSVVGIGSTRSVPAGGPVERGGKGRDCSEIAPDSSGFDRVQPVSPDHHLIPREILMDFLCLVCLLR